ncbi:alginate lyase family protein [Qipengyuania zhejiangensis]|uniref:alginate lyase family protein n=1 Tax=Qipengyuania zhejiangensis TaxID=3077782 RepID=UPI002D784C8B|nr:alginate lyase family protein [Qipengyuania sp. Z2]
MTHAFRPSKWQKAAFAASSFALLGSITPLAPLSAATPAAACVFPQNAISEIRSDKYYRGRNNAIIDSEALDEAMAQSAPLRDMVQRQQTIPADLRADDLAAAKCKTAELAYWARSDALLGNNNQRGFNERLFYISGLALAHRRNLQLMEQAGTPLYEDDAAIIAEWMVKLGDSVITAYTRDPADRRFTSEFIPPRAQRTGNLGAWAAMMVAATGEATGNQTQLRWAGEQWRRVLQTVDSDGAMASEVRRGAKATEYHFFALNPLVATELVLRRNGIPVDGQARANLDRLARYALEGAAQGKLPDPARRNRLFVGPALWCRDLAPGDPSCAAMPDWRQLTFPYLGGAPLDIWER